ncbi:NAD-dependent epimerase/dehydratase family protein [Enterococcus termitis]
MREKIIVTGATGFLGHYVIQELVAQNYEVIAVGRNKKQLVFLEEKYGITPLILDLSDREQVFNLYGRGGSLSTLCCFIDYLWSL